MGRSLLACRSLDSEFIVPASNFYITEIVYTFNKKAINSLTE